MPGEHCAKRNKPGNETKDVCSHLPWGPKTLHPRENGLDLVLWFQLDDERKAETI